MLQLEHAALFLEMSTSMPGQWMQLRALLVMPVVPWCAEYNTSGTSDCRELDVVTLYPTSTPSPIVERSDFTL